MYLKKWGGVGWWWVSSRSGWLLELLTELTKLIVVKTKFSYFLGFREVCHEQDSGVDELSLVLLHSLKCQRPSQYKFFCQYLIETSMDLWTCCPTRLSVQDFQRKALQVQSPPWQSVWVCPVCFGASLRCF